MTIRCTCCKQSFKTNRAFEAHALKCVPAGSTKSLGQMTDAELMAMYEKSIAKAVH